MKAHKPTTAGRRNMTRVSYEKVITAKKPTKALTVGHKRGSGRNSAGRITTRHKGGGVKRAWREVDFRFDKHNVPATIKTVEYDPNRSAYIALAAYHDGERRYVVIPKEMHVGDTFVVAEKTPIKIGNRTKLSSIPVGTAVYAVSLKEHGDAKIARSAGNAAQVVAQDGTFTHLKMPSTEIRKVTSSAWASIGTVSNEEHGLRNIGKAGKSRHMGIRPTVRGSVMNPVDHPHGGGEGRQGRGHRRARSKWGKPTGKGQKTRTPKKYSTKHIVSRRKVGKRG